MVTEPFRPSRGYPPKPEFASAGQLWRHVPIERRLEAARAFWADREATAQHAEAVSEMARLLKFRPQSMNALPAEKKVRHLASLANLSDSIAGQVLVTYHLATQRPMMQAFLDALGIANEDGRDCRAGGTERARFETAPEGGRGAGRSFPPDDVRLYLSTLLVQDGAVMGRSVRPAGHAAGFKRTRSFTPVGRLMKIAFIGSHGVGKTTLCYDLASLLKRQGFNVDMVKEVARLSPLPINRQTSLDAQTWILMTQVAEEIRSSAHHEVVVCDRAVLDNYAYMSFACGRQRAIERFVDYWMKRYDLLFKVPLSGEAQADGVRDTDEFFMRSIDHLVDTLLLEKKVAHERLAEGQRPHWIESVRSTVLNHPQLCGRLI